MPTVRRAVFEHMPPLIGTKLPNSVESAKVWDDQGR
jgi:hypothetical protein